MQVITLGTGSPIPDPNRAGPATLVRAAGRDLLFDCGRAVLMRAAAVGSGPAQFHTVFLTHRHSDHITDLNDVITMQWVMSFGPTPLRIVGPEGTQVLIDKTLDMLTEDMGYRIAHHESLQYQPTVEVTEVSDEVVVDEDGIRIVAAPTEHSPVKPTVGYRIEADGKAVVIAGDTIPCEGLDRLCAGADLYVQTVVRESVVRQIPAPRLQDVLDYHSSIEQAADTAQRNGVKSLVMTHPVPGVAPGTEQEWIDEAQAVFAGEVTLASDLDTYTL
ncbi:MAG: MBL fold metallo-hydrolase [Acidimicrobiales bacterium]|nr:MBL fold metallo-hydrolase [Acidimicrobiales bacterium]